MAATSYVYTVSTDVPSGLVSVARLRSEIELSTILTQIDYNAGGITLLNDGEDLTIWFKDPLSSTDKQTLDGSTSQTPNSPATAGSILGDHSGLALPDDPQAVNVASGTIEATITGGTLDGDGKIKSPDGATFLGDATNPLRTDPTGSTPQPISAASLPLPTGAATEATLATLTTPSDIQPISATSLPLPTGAATEATLSQLVGGLPPSLGRKPEASSLSVALADEQLGTPGVAAPARAYPLAAKQQGATTLRAAASKYDEIEQEYRILVDAKTIIAPPDPPANTTAVTYKSASEVAGTATETENFAIADGVTLTIQQITIGGEGDPNQRGSQITVEYYDGTTYHEIDVYYVQSSSKEFFPSTSKTIDGTVMVGGTGKLIRISRQRLGAGAAIIRCVIRGYTS